VALAALRRIWHRQHMRWWWLLVWFGGLASVLGASCNDDENCECFACGSAITISVVDTNMQPLDAWTLEATLDGDTVDTSDCDAFVRQGNNMCSFGDETGVYQIVVRTEALQKSVAARFAARGGQSCCGGCLNGEVVQVVLP
jgi:hypothetical protein